MIRVMYHNSVLSDKCVESLNIDPDGVYVDATFGGGGHSRLISQKLTSGKLFAFDQDEDCKGHELRTERFKLINTNFRHLKRMLKMEGVEKINGLLADLGVSSHQFDKAERGFSIRNEGGLDMRMNIKSELSAKHIINEYTQEELSTIFYKYGELRNSRRIAREIVASREISKIATTKDLIAIISHLFPERKKNQFLARFFQSIRIEVNDEINSLKEMLNSVVDMLDEKGRVVIISYHSLEDRLVKNFFKTGNVQGDLKKDFFGNIQNRLKQINRKVIIPNPNEIIKNPRARSAKLRIAEKI